MGTLARRDSAGRLLLVDIAEPGFDAQAHGFAAAALDAEIHAVDGDGTVVRGMAALRLVYAAAGLGWVFRPTGSAVLKPAFDAAYRLFARYRRPISNALRPAIRWAAARRAREVGARMLSCTGSACTAPPCSPATIPPRRNRP